jgi:hypothetical protein
LVLTRARTSIVDGGGPGDLELNHLGAEEVGVRVQRTSGVRRTLEVPACRSD